MKDHYRVIASTDTYGNLTFAVHEVNYSTKKERIPTSWCGVSAKASEDNLGELAKQCKRVKRACKKPVLEVYKTKKGRQRLRVFKHWSMKTGEHNDLQK